MTVTEAEVRETLAGCLAIRDEATRSTTLGAVGTTSTPAELSRRHHCRRTRRADWPRRFGGRDADATEAQTDHQGPPRIRDARPVPVRVGMKMLGPTVLEHGSSEQQERWLPPIANGSEIWCQMFSEPDAGSDLANVTTSAVPVPHGWEPHRPEGVDQPRRLRRLGGVSGSHRSPSPPSIVASPCSRCGCLFLA